MNERDARLHNGDLLGEQHDVFISELDLGDTDYEVQDAVNPLSGSLVFGRDIPTQSDLTMTLYSNKSNLAEGLTALRSVGRMWKSGAEKKPGEYSSLTFMLGGREHTVYGRERKFGLVTDALSRRGVAKAVCTFTRTDPYFYAPEVALTLRLNLGSPGGLRAPLRAPLSTGTIPGQRQGIIANEEADTGSPFTATFSGPSRNPSLKVGGKTLKLNMQIPYDRKVIVDTREMSVKWADTGANIVGALSQSSRLSNMKVPAGKNEIVYKADDATNLSTCIVRWAPASYAL